MGVISEVTLHPASEWSVGVCSSRQDVGIFKVRYLKTVCFDIFGAQYRIFVFSLFLINAFLKYFKILTWWANSDTRFGRSAKNSSEMTPPPPRKTKYQPVKLIKQVERHSFVNIQFSRESCCIAYEEKIFRRVTM